MRSLKVVLALALVAALAQSASAVSFGGYVGKIQMKFRNYDVGTLYTLGPGPAGPFIGQGLVNGLPQTPPPGAAPFEDGWGIFRITEIWGTSDGGLTFEVPLWSNATASTELTGMFWGERDTYVLQYIDPASLVTKQAIHGVGLHVAVFEDSAKNFNPAPGPLSRATPFPVYPTVTDGSLIWTVNSVPGWDAGFPTDEFFTVFTPGAAPGAVNAQGGFWGTMGSVPTWGLGPSNNQLDIPNLVDVMFGFDGRASTGWMVISNDPVEATVVPEPLTMLGVLASVGGIAGYIRKRRLA